MVTRAIGKIPGGTNHAQEKLKRQVWWSSISNFDTISDTQQLFRRDGNRCVVSGAYDTEQWKALTKQEQLTIAESDWTEAVHVIPLSLGLITGEQVRDFLLLLCSLKKIDATTGPKTTFADLSIAPGHYNSMGLYIPRLPGDRSNIQYRGYKRYKQCVHSSFKPS